MRKMKYEAFQFYNEIKHQIKITNKKNNYPLTVIKVCASGKFLTDSSKVNNKYKTK